MYTPLSSILITTIVLNREIPDCLSLLTPRKSTLTHSSHSKKKTTLITQKEMPARQTILKTDSPPSTWMNRSKGRVPSSTNSRTSNNHSSSSNSFWNQDPLPMWLLPHSPVSCSSHNRISPSPSISKCSKPLFKIRAPLPSSYRRPLDLPLQHPARTVGRINSTRRTRKGRTKATSNP